MQCSSCLTNGNELDDDGRCLVCKEAIKAPVTLLKMPCDPGNFPYMRACFSCAICGEPMQFDGFCATCHRKQWELGKLGEALRHSSAEGVERRASWEYVGSGERKTKSKTRRERRTRHNNTLTTLKEAINE
jgi:hypothetical protein